VNDKTILSYEIYLAGKSISEATRENYLKFPKAFLRHTQKPVDEITQTDIDEYVRYYIRNKKHNGNATRFRCLKYFFNWLEKDFDLPMLSIRETDKAVLNDDQTDILMETVKNMSATHKLIFYLEYDGIRRPNEIRNIHINWRNGDVLYYNGKTHKDHIILTERLMEAWDEYIECERPIPRTVEDSKYLLLSKNQNPNKHGTQLKRTMFITRHIRELVMESGVTVPLGEVPTNYLIKRTSITRQLKLCRDPKIIQLQAGHSSLAITMRYNRISDDDRRAYFHRMTRVYKKKHDSGLSENDSGFVLKTIGDLPQDLNKINGGELKDNNTSFSFSISFFDIIGTEKVYGHNIFLISPGQNISPSSTPTCCPCTSDMPMGVFF
jgi:integrase